MLDFKRETWNNTLNIGQSSHTNKQNLSQKFQNFNKNVVYNKKIYKFLGPLLSFGVFD